jgi:hypothetical protein
VSAFSTTNAVEGVEVVDEVAYISGYSFAHALDVHDPTAPVLLWSYSGPAEGVDIEGRGLFALAADGYLGVAVHAIADGRVRPWRNNPAAVFPEEPLVATFARPMSATTVSYACSPDPGGWEEAWGPAGMSASRILTLTHDPFAEGQTHTFEVTGGLTAGGDPIEPFGLTFSVPALNRVYLPVMMRDQGG